METMERIAHHEAGHTLAALVFGIPVIEVTIVGRPGLYRGRYRAAGCLERIVTLCLSGPAAEQLFFGSITPGSDRTD
jgi:hypothetical protein